MNSLWQVIKKKYYAEYLEDKAYLLNVYDDFKSWHISFETYISKFSVKELLKLLWRIIKGFFLKVFVWWPFSILSYIWNLVIKYSFLPLQESLHYLSRKQGVSPNWKKVALYFDYFVLFLSSICGLTLLIAQILDFWHITRWEYIARLEAFELQEDHIVNFINKLLNKFSFIGRGIRWFKRELMTDWIYRPRRFYRKKLHPKRFWIFRLFYYGTGRILMYNLYFVYIKFPIYVYYRVLWARGKHKIRIFFRIQIKRSYRNLCFVLKFIWLQLNISLMIALIQCKFWRTIYLIGKIILYSIHYVRVIFLIISAPFVEIYLFILYFFFIRRVTQMGYFHFRNIWLYMKYYFIDQKAKKAKAKEEKAKEEKAKKAKAKEEKEMKELPKLNIKVEETPKINTVEDLDAVIAQSEARRARLNDALASLTQQIADDTRADKARLSKELASIVDESFMERYRKAKSEIEEVNDKAIKDLEEQELATNTKELLEDENKQELKQEVKDELQKKPVHKRSYIRRPEELKLEYVGVLDEEIESFEQQKIEMREQLAELAKEEKEEKAEKKKLEKAEKKEKQAREQLEKEVREDLEQMAKELLEDENKQELEQEVKDEVAKQAKQRVAKLFEKDEMKEANKTLLEALEALQKITKDTVDKIEDKRIIAIKEIEKREDLIGKELLEDANKQQLKQEVKDEVAKQAKQRVAKLLENDVAKTAKDEVAKTLREELAKTAKEDTKEIKEIRSIAWYELREIKTIAKDEMKEANKTLLEALQKITKDTVDKIEDKRIIAIKEIEKREDLIGKQVIAEEEIEEIEEIEKLALRKINELEYNTIYDLKLINDKAETDFSSRLNKQREDIEKIKETDRAREQEFKEEQEAREEKAKKKRKS